MTEAAREMVRRALQDRGDPPSLEEVLALLDAFEDEDPTDPKERRRLRIVDHAIELFVRHGYRRTSVDDVARAAHVAKGTVYLHFKNKAELLVAAITEEKVRYARRLGPLMTAEMEPRDKLRLWLGLALRMSAELPLLARLLSGDRELMAVLHDVDEVLGIRATEMQLRFLARLLTEALPDLPAEAAEERARLLLSLVYVAGHFGDEPSRFGLPLDRHAELLADTLVRGLRAEAATAAEGGSS